MSFTKLDKLGLNPSNSGFAETPIGIYAYPLDYAVGVMGDSGEAAEFIPYAGDGKYANIFTAQGNFVDLGKISDDEVDTYIDKLSTARIRGRRIKELVEPLTPGRYKPGIRLWKVFEFTAANISNLLDTKEISVVYIWTKLFLMAGIEGVIDPGTGVIHSSEPVQAVFFTIAACKDIRRVHNSYSPNDSEAGQALGRRRTNYAQAINKLTVDDDMEHFIHRIPSDTGKIEAVLAIRNRALRDKMLVKFAKDIAGSKRNHYLSDRDRWPIIMSDPAQYAWLANQQQLLALSKQFPHKTSVNHAVINAAVALQTGEAKQQLTPELQFVIVNLNPNAIFKIYKPSYQAAKHAIALGVDAKRVQAYYQKNR